MIWCDLDNTLIWTWEPLITTPLLSAVFGLPLESRPPQGKGLRRLTRVDVPDLGTGFACRRKTARRFLDEIRLSDRVAMLTSALRSYAIAMNEIFELGFAADEILARENLRDRKTGNVEPYAVLVDNAPRFPRDDGHHAARRRKLRYLGASSEAVIEVPHFHGQMDDPFDQDWRKYVAHIQTLAGKARQ
jgi:hypothetical protein